MQKKAMLLLTVSIPTIIILAVVLAIALLLISKVLSTTISVNDNGFKADTALYAMLNSNDCTPNTKLAFKDVLGIGIAEGKKFSIRGTVTDTINIDYNGIHEEIIVPRCLDTLRGRVIPAIPSLFYVEYFTCPGTYRRCFADEFRPAGFGNVPLNAESVEYITLPNGDIAKAVLKTSGG